MFDYYSVKFRLRTEMLGTCSSASVWDTHVLQKAKKEIKKANQMTDKLTKIAEQYVGPEIEEEKHIKELQAIIRTFSGLIGEVCDPMPDNVEDLLAKANDIEAKYNEKVKKAEEMDAKVFMRMPRNGDDNDHAVISTHMILGNLKKNMRVMVNNGDKSILKSKVSVGEVFALDVKPVEEFMFPSNDIMRDKNGKRQLCERIVHFDRLGKQESAISMAEQLPKGTTFECILRVRKNSPIGEKELKQLLLLGKSNGLGSWRSSGGKGQFDFKLKRLKNYKEEVEGSKDGWM